MSSNKKKLTGDILKNINFIKRPLILFKKYRILTKKHLGAKVNNL